MLDSKISLSASNLKCFGEASQGFDEIKRINLIVGRNNAGKSSLIDMVRQATNPDGILDTAHWHKNRPPQIFVETSITQDDVTRAFPINTSGGQISGNHFEFGQQFIGGRARVLLLPNRHSDLVSLWRHDSSQYPDINGLGSCGTTLGAQPGRNPLSGKIFRRLAAERDIVQEPDSQNQQIEVQENGRGITNLIQCFLNKSHLPSDLIEVTLLGALNEVFGPDGQFTNIVCQQHTSNLWEVFLGQENKGRIALSASGSGLKTIIQALCFIHLLPVLAKQSLDNYIFAFEELENNLHPALQRRLLTYIAKQARTQNFIVFFTTHSNVAIDIFNTQPDAQICHVIHDGQDATCKTVKAFIEHSGVLDDLDVRASDLLQANGIIWVEGPSDRIYLNKWIELCSDGQLLEGTHYQCVFYGGRLLAHLSGQIPDDDDDKGVSILRVNRNAIVVIDSDKRARATPINGTKKRVAQEIKAINGLAWITHGREIENYISGPTIARWRNLSTAPALQNIYDSFFEHLETIEAGIGARYSAQKPLLAEQICAATTVEDIRADPQLSEQLQQVCRKIRAWNNI